MGFDADPIAIIPARSGSKGVIDKNIRPLNGKPLIYYTIAACKLAGIARVFVSTDSEAYQRIAIECGAEAPFLRPKSIAGDKSADIDFLKHALQWCSLQTELRPKIILHMRPTTPFRDPKVIQHAISVMLSDNWHFLRSAERASESPMKWFRRNKDGSAAPLFPDFSLAEINSARQSFTDAFIPNGYIDIASAEQINNGHLYDHGVFLYETDPSPEVDTESDFDLLETLSETHYKSLVSKLKGEK